MKIAFYSTMILEYGGGFEQFLIRTAEGLRHYGGAEVDIFTMDEKFNERLESWLSLYYRRSRDSSLMKKNATHEILKEIAPSGYKKCSSLRELKEALRTYDVVYSKNEVLEAFLLKFIVNYKNLPPVIFSCGTPIYYPIADSLTAKLHNVLYTGAAYKYLTSGAAGFHSKNSADHAILKRLHPDKRIEKIYNPLDVDDLQAKARRFLLDITWDRSKCNILWAGRLTEQKGVHDFIRAVEEVNTPSVQDHVVWYIAGDGELRKDILALAGKWSNVNYLGFVDPKYMPNVYQNCDLFVSTSKWEGSPNAIAEALAFGLTVIAYNVPGPRDILSDNDRGVLVDDRSQLARRISEKISELFQERIHAPASSAHPKAGAAMERFSPRSAYTALHAFLLSAT